MRTMSALSEILTNFISKTSIRTINKSLRYLGAFAPVATGILGPIALYISRRNSSPEDRKAATMQESLIQASNIAFHLTAFFGLGFIGRKVLKQVRPGAFNSIIKEVAGVEVAKLPPKLAKQMVNDTRELIVTLVMNVGGLLGAVAARYIGGGLVEKMVQKPEKGMEADTRHAAKPIESLELGQPNAATRLVKPAPHIMSNETSRISHLDVSEENAPRIQGPIQSLPLEPTFSQQPYYPPQPSQQRVMPPVYYGLNYMPTYPASQALNMPGRFYFH